MRRARRADGQRTAAAIGTVLATIAAGAATAPAASAADGTGWGASWDYYTGESFRYSFERPGLHLQGYSTDRDGTRRTLGTLRDTRADGKCARLRLFTEHGQLTEVSACDRSDTAYFSPSATFTGNLLVLACVSATGDTNEGCAHTHVPSSARDPEIRRAGVGASWSYYTPSSYTFRLRRPGVLVTGYGRDQSGGGRSAHVTVEHTEAGGCGTTALRAARGTPSDASACGAPGTSEGAAHLSTFAVGGWIAPSACSTDAALNWFTGRWFPTGPRRCVDMHVPEPV